MIKRSPFRYFKTPPEVIRLAVMLYTGEEIEADADILERVIGVEVGYIDWAVKEGRKFLDRDWVVRVSQYSGDPIGTEDLFAKWNRIHQR